MSEFVLNAAALVVYIGVLVYGSIALYESRITHHPTHIRYAIMSLVALSMSVSAIFSVMQVSWIYSSVWQNLSAVDNIGWMVYDWVNGMAHLAFILTARVFLSWKILPSCKRSACPANALMNVQRSQTNDLHMLGNAYNDLLSRLDEMAQEEHLAAMEKSNTI